MLMKVVKLKRVEHLGPNWWESSEITVSCPSFFLFTECDPTCDTLVMCQVMGSAVAIVPVSVSLRHTFSPELSWTRQPSLQEVSLQTPTDPLLWPCTVPTLPPDRWPSPARVIPAQLQKVAIPSCMAFHKWSGLLCSVPRMRGVRGCQH